MLQRKVAGFNMWNPASPHHDLAKDVAAQRHRPAPEPELLLSARFREFYLAGRKRNLLLQFAKRGFAHSNSIYVVLQQKIFRVVLNAHITCSLKSVNVKRSVRSFYRLAHPSAARGQAVALVERV